MSTFLGLTEPTTGVQWKVMDATNEVPTEAEEVQAEADYAGMLAYLRCIMEEAEYSNEPVNWRAVDDVYHYQGVDYTPPTIQ